MRGWAPPRHVCRAMPCCHLTPPPSDPLTGRKALAHLTRMDGSCTTHPLCQACVRLRAPQPLLCRQQHACRHAQTATRRRLGPRAPHVAACAPPFGRRAARRQAGPAPPGLCPFWALLRRRPALLCACPPSNPWAHASLRRFAGFSRFLACADRRPLNAPFDRGPQSRPQLVVCRGPALPWLAGHADGEPRCRGHPVPNPGKLPAQRQQLSS